MCIKKKKKKEPTQTLYKIKFSYSKYLHNMIIIIKKNNYKNIYFNHNIILVYLWVQNIINVIFIKLHWYHLSRPRASHVTQHPLDVAEMCMERGKFDFSNFFTSSASPGMVEKVNSCFVSIQYSNTNICHHSHYPQKIVLRSTEFQCGRFIVDSRPSSVPRVDRSARHRRRFADSQTCRRPPRKTCDTISNSCSTEPSTWPPAVRLLSCVSPACSGTRFSPVFRTAADSSRSLCASAATNTCCWRIRVPVPTAGYWWTPSWSVSSFRNPCRSRRCPVEGLRRHRFLKTKI